MIGQKEGKIQDKEIKYYELREAQLEYCDKLTKQQNCKNRSGCCRHKNVRFFSKLKGNILVCLSKGRVFKIYTVLD